MEDEAGRESSSRWTRMNSGYLPMGGRWGRTLEQFSVASCSNHHLKQVKDETVRWRNSRLAFYLNYLPKRMEDEAARTNNSRLESYRVDGKCQWPSWVVTPMLTYSHLVPALWNSARILQRVHRAVYARRGAGLPFCWASFWIWIQRQLLCKEIPTHYIKWAVKRA